MLKTIKELTDCGYEKGLSGWLSPFGEFYSASHGQHNNVAIAIEESGKVRTRFDSGFRILHGGTLLENLGYIKFVCPDWGDCGGNAHVFFPQIYGFSGDITKHQSIWIEKNRNSMSANQENDIEEYTQILKSKFWRES
jgi:hypothetical protein